MVINFSSSIHNPELSNLGVSPKQGKQVGYIQFNSSSRWDSLGVEGNEHTSLGGSAGGACILESLNTGDRTGGGD